MEHLLNQSVKQIEISGIRQFFNKVAHLEDVISFTIGQPDFKTPDHIKDYAIQSINQNFTNYTHNAGFLELREELSKWMESKYASHYDAESEIIVTTGASQGIDAALRTILSNGCEVILPGPVYPGYEPIIRLAGGVPVYVDTTKTDFKLNVELLQSHVTENTRCIILPYPSNPTGVSLTRCELEEIAEFVKGKDIFILSDEIYSELTYTGEHTSMGQLLREQTIVINGLSKSHSMTGWRIGFIFGPKEIMKHILKVHQYNVSCASSISQKAAYEAIKNGMNDPIEMKKEYDHRRKYVLRRLKEMNLYSVEPDGAFYFFVKIPFEGITSFDFCMDVAENYKVALVPGSAFSSWGEGFFRLSYACSFEQLEAGLNRLERYMSDKKRT
ncbi:aromatic amino acid aminotransferase [Bacillus coahuilensis p1.1.43]|uniref:Aminotransferase n=1 Tax=Bacillus coahuilensis p1.1.43 TaxID=1150625 RepID=A0A147KAF2_9BACI|nr:aminotransferase A [Bacillus coahuilensis]KUP07610.1 aromatic amino acid aminotransferase [Bacillus coahuilensis p1.1.43]